MALQDDSSLGKIIYWAGRILLLKLLRKVIMGYAQGIGPLRTKTGRLLSRLIVDNIDIMTCRDLESRNVLVSLGVRKTPLLVTADPALALDRVNGDVGRQLLQEMHLAEGQRPILAIAPRRWFHLKGAIIPRQLTSRLRSAAKVENPEFDRLLQVLATTGDYFVEKFEAKVLLIPMCVMPWDSDVDVCHKVKSLMKYQDHTAVFDCDCEVPKLMSLLSQCWMTIGVRMHSTILSMVSGVPAVHLWYVPKGRALFRALGQEMRALPVDRVLTDKGQKEFLTIATETWRNREVVMSELSGPLCQLRKKARSTTDILLDLVEGYPV